MTYYVRRQLQNGGREYIIAPKGWRWTTQCGAIKGGEYKGAPETSTDPYKRYLFKSERGAKIQANMLPGSEILTC